MFCSIKNTKFIFQISFKSFSLYCINFFDNSFNLFLFEVTFSRLLSKFVFFTKLDILLLLAKFVFANLVWRLSDINLLKSWVVINLSWSWSELVSFPVSLIFVLWSVFFNELITLGILFLTALEAVVVSKLVILGI